MEDPPFESSSIKGPSAICDSSDKASVLRFGLLTPEAFFWELGLNVSFRSVDRRAGDRQPPPTSSSDANVSELHLGSKMMVLQGDEALASPLAVQQFSHRPTVEFDQDNSRRARIAPATKPPSAIRRMLQCLY